MNTLSKLVSPEVLGRAEAHRHLPAARVAYAGAGDFYGVEKIRIAVGIGLHEEQLRAGSHRMRIFDVERRLYVPAGAAGRSGRRRAARASAADGSGGFDDGEIGRRQIELGDEGVEVGGGVRIVIGFDERDRVRAARRDRRHDVWIAAGRDGDQPVGAGDGGRGFDQGGQIRRQASSGRNLGREAMGGGQDQNLHIGVHLSGGCGRV